jgi:hypothetical protein
MLNSDRPVGAVLVQPSAIELLTDSLLKTSSAQPAASRAVDGLDQFGFRVNFRRATSNGLKSGCVACKVNVMIVKPGDE